MDTDAHGFEESTTLHLLSRLASFLKPFSVRAICTTIWTNLCGPSKFQTGSERGCVVLDQPQHAFPAKMLRLVSDTAALRSVAALPRWVHPCLNY